MQQTGFYETNLVEECVHFYKNSDLSIWIFWRLENVHIVGYTVKTKTKEENSCANDLSHTK